MDGKRLFDILVSGLGLLLLGPLMFILALTVRWTSAGPVIYRARRVGQGEVPFDMFKFRTMVATADVDGPAVTMHNDPRITPIGQILRHHHLDELPQLINVLRGDMSLVGPRPEAPVYVAEYQPEDRIVLAVRPGITGLAQLSFSDEAWWLGSRNPDRYVTEILPRKLAVDRTYIQTRSFRLDLAIIADTLLVMLARPPQFSSRLAIAATTHSYASSTLSPITPSWFRRHDEGRVDGRG
jgi:lipopolysaccharide/colanic/teichoic acid biosynthesis glycosyltransferase